MNCFQWLELKVAHSTVSRLMGISAICNKKSITNRIYKRQAALQSKQCSKMIQTKVFLELVEGINTKRCVNDEIWYIQMLFIDWNKFQMMILLKCNQPRNICHLSSFVCTWCIQKNPDFLLRWTYLFSRCRICWYNIFKELEPKWIGHQRLVPTKLLSESANNFNACWMLCI